MVAAVVALVVLDQTQLRILTLDLLQSRIMVVPEDHLV
jgi:hypothetical protein